MTTNWPHAERFPVPEALRIEHNEIRAGLAHACLQHGAIGRAARQALRFCVAHFEEEERILFPVFGLLHDLATGRIEREMADVLPLLARFIARYDRLLLHHQSISKALGALLEAAHREGNREVANVAYMARLHERMEEEVTYPTAVLIGNHLRARLGASAEAGDCLRPDACTGTPESRH